MPAAMKPFQPSAPRVDVADDPVGVVRERVDALDREQRPLERRHAVERDAGDEELEHRIVAQLVPRAAQREQAVEHAAPATAPTASRRTPCRASAAQSGSAV